MANQLDLIKQNSELQSKVEQYKRQWVVAMREVERLYEENEKFRDFISACRYAGNDGLPQLRTDANKLCSEKEN